jgi:hypothetical protein
MAASNRSGASLMTRDAGDWAVALAALLAVAVLVVRLVG